MGMPRQSKVIFIIEVELLICKFAYLVLVGITMFRIMKAMNKIRATIDSDNLKYFLVKIRSLMMNRSTIVFKTLKRKEAAIIMTIASKIPLDLKWTRKYSVMLMST
jgi:hypothetical protein